jgi:hypothetical protein
MFSDMVTRQAVPTEEKGKKANTDGVQCNYYTLNAFHNPTAQKCGRKY